MRCRFAIVVGLLLGLSGWSTTLAAAPNILVIVGDDMGYSDVGFHGCKDIPTPHLDALAASGVRFTNGYVSGPYCSPTRAGLMSGRYQTRFGHEFNPGGEGGTTGMPTSEATLANRLKSAGYVTGLVGKWHLGGAPQFHPQRRGFDEFFGFLGGSHDYFKSQEIVRGNEPVKEAEYLTDAFAREAVAFIDRHQAEPWFLYLAFNAVHTPMQADDARLQKFAHIADTKRRTYAAMMFAMDEAIGQVRKKLVDAKLDQNTLVTFVSDNGGPTMVGTTTNGSNNTPLRGSKRTTLEGGVRVPFVVSWPGKVKPACLINQRSNSTCMRQRWPRRMSRRPRRSTSTALTCSPISAARSKARLMSHFTGGFSTQMAIRNGDYKLVRYDPNVDSPGDKSPVSQARLYRLSDDIGESKDLSEAMPDKVKELQAKWDAWNATLAKPLWGGRGDGKNGKNAENAKTK